MITDHPFIADFWDFFILVLAVLVRFMFALKTKIKAKGELFSFAAYFDPKHMVRWAGHLITAFSFLLFLPQIYEDYLAPEYLPALPYWSFAGDFLLGFAGYDLIKLLEKATTPLLEKITGKK